MSVFVACLQAFNAAAARVADSEASKFFDVKAGKPKSELKGGKAGKA